MAVEFVSPEFDDAGVEYTSRKPVLRGVFQLSKSAVPYFVANLSLDELESELKLVEDMPSDYRANWTIEELFQRDLDWARVEQDLVTNYLRRRDKRTFFNALTVALLPRGEDGMLAEEYAEPRRSELPVDEGPFGHAEYDTQNIGGVQLAWRRKGEPLVAYMRWNKASVFPATIDGQHRLAALRMLIKDFGLTSAQKKTRISVIFLVLDPRVGFKMDDSLIIHPSGNPLLGIVREVFIDLNKHAISVSTTRQVLLDDQEIEARCVRSLIGNRIGVDTDDVLPLGLVNWTSDEVKFDVGPHFTTVYVLYLIVSDILSLSYPSDPLDPTQVRRFVSIVQSTLNLDAVIDEADGPRGDDYRHLTDSLLEYVTENHLDAENPIPFRALPPAYSSAAVDGFDRYFKPLLLAVFFRFNPYRQFRELSKKVGGVDGDLALYLGQGSKVQMQQRKDWSDEEFRKKISEPRETLRKSKEGKWAFKVVFQKAVLRATVAAKNQADVILGEGVSTDEFLEDWIESLNDWDSRGLFEVDAEVKAGHLWEGICKNPVSRTIRYSNAATMRIRDLLVLFWYLRHSGGGSPEDFLRALTRSSSNREFPEGGRCADRVLKSLVGAIRVLNPDEEEDGVLQMAKERLLEILARSTP